MSFETATQFLTSATMQGNTDTMAAPSARIVLGRVVEMGTGAISLMQNFPKCEPEPSVPMKATVVSSG
jgi:DNA-directed RNA polymerase I subunit RPA1